MAKKTEFQVTIGYKAVICFMVKAENEQEARTEVLQKVKDKGIYEGELQDETYSASGVLNMDTSWNMVQS